MKIKVVLLVLSIAFAFSANAQFFKPNPRPFQPGELRLGLSATGMPLTQNFIKPIIGITASVSNGTQLAGGAGISFTHDRADTASNTWVIQYSISAIGFLGTNGNKITGTAGLIFGIPGTAGLIQIGPGYDFTFKQIVLLTGVGINF